MTDTAMPRELPNLVWSPALWRPARPPKLVYLDLNHFICLARAAQGHSTPKGYLDLLAACRAAKIAGYARFVLSAVHYAEMVGIRNPQQRADVAAVMEELTGFTTLLGRTNIVKLELTGALAALVGEPPPNVRLDVIGYGGRYAFGIQGGFTIRDIDGRDVTNEAREEMGHDVFDAFAERADRELERGLLAGPSDAEAAILRKTTPFRPETIREGNERRAQQERDLAARLDAEPRWRRGRLRDVISARELGLEWLEQFNAASNGNFDKVNEALSDRGTARAFSESMPSWRVAITMKTRYHRDPAHNWTGNDINDIDAMAIAVPYCDAVFTDAAARNTLAAAPEVRVFNTFLPRKPEQMTAWLTDLPELASQPAAKQ